VSSTSDAAAATSPPPPPPASKIDVFQTSVPTVRSRSEDAVSSSDRSSYSSGSTFLIATCILQSHDTREGTTVPLSKAPMDKLFIAFFAFALVVCAFVDVINVIAPVGSITPESTATWTWPPQPVLAAFHWYAQLNEMQCEF
jgi:hypothetical protein